MGTVRSALFLIGTVAGAGFLTGAELVRFFGGSGYFLAFFFACALSCFFGIFYLRLGQKYGGCKGVLRALFGRGAFVIHTILLALTFLPCAGMLAGLDALLPTYAPLPSIVGLLIVVGFLLRGLKGVGALNTALVPFVLSLVLLTGSGNIYFAIPNLSQTGHAFLYSGMNLAFSAPALMDAGEQIRHPTRSCVIASVCIFCCGICILGGIYASGEPLLPMPYLRVIEGRRVFAVAICCSVLTSLSCALYPLFNACERLGKQKSAARCIVLVAAFLLSRIGLENVIDVFYPVAGAIGIFFSIVCIFDEYFFKQHHKGIHTRCKQTKYKGSAHHKVKFEHLTAVYDQIAKPRPRNDIFTHNRADPRHTDVDLQHGNHGRIGRGNHEFP